MKRRFRLALIVAMGIACAVLMMGCAAGSDANAPEGKSAQPGGGHTIQTRARL